MVQTNKLKQSSNNLILELIEEYAACKSSVLSVVDSTVRDKAEVEAIGKEEVKLIVPKYNKLKHLSQILRSEASNSWGVPSNGQYDQNLQDNVRDNDIETIILEFHRKCLLIKIDIFGRIRSAIDYTPVFTLLQNLSSLNSLDEIIGKLLHFILTHFFKSLFLYF